IDLSNRSAPGFAGRVFSVCLPRPACGERSPRSCAAGEGVPASPHLHNSRQEPLTPTLSPQERGEGEEEPPQFIFTSGQPPLSSGRKASSAGTVASSL